MRDNRLPVVSFLSREYFADGMVEKITTALSRFKWFVIARNSSFTFKGKAVDVKDCRK
jgi:adenylate cyclase